MLCRKHFQEGSAEPQISPLRSPGFPVESCGVDSLHAVSFTGNRSRGPGDFREVGNPGYPSVQMTKGRAALPGTVVAEQEPFFITLGGPKAHDSLRPGPSPRRPNEPVPKRRHSL